MTQVALVETLAELLHQGLSQLRQQALAICRASLTALFELDDGSANLPTGLYLHHVHVAQHLLAGLRDQSAQRIQQTMRCLSVRRWGEMRVIVPRSTCVGCKRRTAQDRAGQSHSASYKRVKHRLELEHASGLAWHAARQDFGAKAVLDKLNALAA